MDNREWTDPALVLRDGDQEELERLTRSSMVSAGAAKQDRIVVLAADRSRRIRSASGWVLPTEDPAVAASLPGPGNGRALRPKVALAARTLTSA